LNGTYTDKTPKVPTWFALADDPPLFAFAGIWCRWHGTRGTKKNPVEGEHTLFGFLTSDANATVKEQWLTAPPREALELQRPLPEDALQIVMRGGKENAIAASRRLEREAGRNIEVMWLLGRLAPDHRTIADFRKDNGAALRQVCARFVELCRDMGLLTTTSVAIDGSKFKAVNNRDKNFTRTKVERRRAQLEESVARYLSQLDTADLQEPTEPLAVKVTRLKEKPTKLKEQMGKLAVYKKQMLASPDQQISSTARSNPNARRSRSGGSRAGSTSICSKLCSSVLTQTRKLCASAARRSNIHSAP
jgi:hypothetical protein